MKQHPQSCKKTTQNANSIPNKWESLTYPLLKYRSVIVSTNLHEANLKKHGIYKDSAHYHPKTGPFQHDPTSGAPCAKWIHIFGPFWAWPRTEGLDPPIDDESRQGSRSRRWIVGNDTPSTYVDTKVVLVFRKRFYVFFSRHFLGEERKKSNLPPDNWPEDSQRSCLQVSGLQ